MRRGPPPARSGGEWLSTRGFTPRRARIYRGEKRKRVEEPFGWGKTIGGLARPMLRGVKKLDFKFTLTMAAYDLIKLPRLIGVTA